jgi:hypothetical protein
MVLALIVNRTRQSPENSGYAFERFHIANATVRERFQFEVNLPAGSSGKLAPLADGGGCELDLFHIPHIA